MSDRRATIDGMLSDADRALLDLEARFYRLPGAKEQAIHDELGMTATRYYQRLMALTDRREAWEYAPAVVKRLRAATTRQQDQRLLGLSVK